MRVKVKSTIISGGSWGGSVPPGKIDEALLEIVGDHEYLSHTVAADCIRVLGILEVLRFVYLTVVYREKSAE